jgi:transcriptional regulator with XRE-family HTH domain
MTETEKLSRRHERRTERLKLALERKGWTKWKFQRELQTKRIPGTSRANIDRYLKGEVDKPAVDFYVEAACLLEVPLLWLLGETEAATDQELAAENIEREKAIREYWEGFDQEMARGFRAYDSLSDHVRGVILSAWAAYDHYLTFQMDPPTTSHAGVREIGAAISAPLTELGINVSDLNRWQLDQYVTAVCQAIVFLNPKYGLVHPRIAS